MRPPESSGSALRRPRPPRVTVFSEVRTKKTFAKHTPGEPREVNEAVNGRGTAAGARRCPEDAPTLTLAHPVPPRSRTPRVTGHLAEAPCVAMSRLTICTRCSG